MRQDGIFPNQPKEEESMNKITTIGQELAKSEFHAVCGGVFVGMFGNRGRWRGSRRLAGNCG